MNRDFNIAPPLLAFILRRLGRRAALLGTKVYFLPEMQEDYRLRARYQIRMNQLYRMGILKYYSTFIYEWLLYGYWEMPMEQEVRGYK